MLVAVGVLFYMQFNPSEQEKSEEGILNSAEYAVAYINSDSVLKNYEYFDELQKELQEKSKKLEAEYQNRAQGLQKEVNDYQRNINNLTIGQAKALEEDLMKKQQNLRMYQESLSQELLKEENRVSQELYNRVTKFLQDYSEQNGLQLVVKYNQGSDVLYASDSMNITSDVINGLNKAYKEGNTENSESDTTSVE
nr:OmpH family outer membrane protein [Fulvivirga aurantia]